MSEVAMEPDMSGFVPPLPPGPRPSGSGPPPLPASTASTPVATATTTAPQPESAPEWTPPLPPGPPPPGTTHEASSPRSLPPPLPSSASTLMPPAPNQSRPSFDGPPPPPADDDMPPPPARDSTPSPPPPPPPEEDDAPPPAPDSPHPDEPVPPSTAPPPPVPAFPAVLAADAPPSAVAAASTSTPPASPPVAQSPSSSSSTAASVDTPPSMVRAGTVPSTVRAPLPLPPLGAAAGARAPLRNLPPLGPTTNSAATAAAAAAAAASSSSSSSASSTTTATTRPAATSSPVGVARPLTSTPATAGARPTAASGASSPTNAGGTAGVRRPESLAASSTPKPATGSYQSLSSTFGEPPSSSGGGGSGGSSSSSSLGLGSLGGPGPKPKSTFPAPTTDLEKMDAVPVAAAGSTAGQASATPAVVKAPVPPSPFADAINRLTGRVPHPLSTAAAIKVGWLKKEGEGVLGGFKKRWCVLSSKTLEFFKEVTDDRGLGHIILPGASVFAEDTNIIHILPVVGKTSSFKAETEKDRAIWLKLLQELTSVPDQLAAAVFDPDSYAEWTPHEFQSILLPGLTRLLAKVDTMHSIWGVGDGSVGVMLSGYLTKVGDKVRNFKRRYFVLVGGMLLYFENEESYMLTDTGNAGPAGPARLHVSSAVSGVPNTDIEAPRVRLRESSLPGDKTAHGKEVFASLARTHSRATTTSTAAQKAPGAEATASNHHLLRRASSMMTGTSAGLMGMVSATSALDDERKKLIKRAIKGEGKPALGMISLRDASVSMEPTPLNVPGSRPFGFFLTTPARRFHLFAESEEELRGWMYMLTLQVVAMPLKNYMRAALEAQASADAALKASQPPPSNLMRPIVYPEPELSIPQPDELVLMKKQLGVILHDPPQARIFQCWWLERQSFHKVRSYPQLLPLDSPLSLETERGTSYFQGMLRDEAGDAGEASVPLPIHYLSFLLACDNWAQLKAPAEAEGGDSDDSNPHALPSDPFFVGTCVTSPFSYRQALLEEIVETYLVHGAPYPVYLEQNMLDEILAGSMRGTSAPNKIAPAQNLLTRAQELVTDLLALEILPRYLRSRSPTWNYLLALQAKFDETQWCNRAELLLPGLLARPENYESMSVEEKEGEEEERLTRHPNLRDTPPKELEAMIKEAATIFGSRPNTDPSRLLVHNYLYALERLQKYHALFVVPESNPPKNPLPLAQRQVSAAWAIYHDFLAPGSRWALCIPSKLLPPLRERLLTVASLPRGRFIFMDIENLVLTELRHALGALKDRDLLAMAKDKSKNSKNNQAQAASHASSSNSNGGAGMGGGFVPFAYGGLRRSVAAGDGMVLKNAPPPQVATFNSSILVVETPAEDESDIVPFNMVFGVSALFASLRRYALATPAPNPERAIDQLRLVSRCFDYRSLSGERVLQLFARQTYSQFCADAAPNKVVLSKAVQDQLRVAVSHASPGPHCFLGVLRELYKNLEPFYASLRSDPAASTLYQCLREEFTHFVGQELAVTQGKVPQDIHVSHLSNNRNAATWIDISDAQMLKDMDESLVNLSSHQAMWIAYFKQFLVERFCSENGAFYAEADDYRRAPCPVYRAIQAKRLYEKYISAQAELQVNVPSWMARELGAVLSSKAAAVGASSAAPASVPASRPSAAAPLPAGVAGAAAATSGAGSISSLGPRSPLLFIAAQREIFLLVLNDSLKPFLDSQPYKNYRQGCQAKITL